MQSLQACMYLYLWFILHIHFAKHQTKSFWNLHIYNCGNRTNNIRHYAEIDRSTSTKNLGRLTGASTKKKTLSAALRNFFLVPKSRAVVVASQIFPSRLFIAKQKLYNVGQSTFLKDKIFKRNFMMTRTIKCSIPGARRHATKNNSRCLLCSEKCYEKVSISIWIQLIWA